MKKAVLVLSLIAFVFTGCKKNPKTQKHKASADTTNIRQAEKTDITVITGEFYYTPEAAVIKGNNFIYGVVLDSMAKVLAEKVEPVKRNKYDMIPITIKGKLEANPMEGGWDQVVKITDILLISKPQGEPAIKIGTQKTVKINNQKNKNS